jgi:hypothetical protein
LRLSDISFSHFELKNGTRFIALIKKSVLRLQSVKMLLLTPILRSFMNKKVKLCIFICANNKILHSLVTNQFLLTFIYEILIIQNCIKLPLYKFSFLNNYTTEHHYSPQWAWQLFTHWLCHLQSSLLVHVFSTDVKHHWPLVSMWNLSWVTRLNPSLAHHFQHLPFELQLYSYLVESDSSKLFWAGCGAGVSTLGNICAGCTGSTVAAGFSSIGMVFIGSWMKGVLAMSSW